MATLTFNELTNTVNHFVLEPLSFGIAFNKWVSELCEKDNPYLHYLYKRRFKPF